MYAVRLMSDPINKLARVYPIEFTKNHIQFLELSFRINHSDLGIDLVKRTALTYTDAVRQEAHKFDLMSIHNIIKDDWLAGKMNTNEGACLLYTQDGETSAALIQENKVKAICYSESTGKTYTFRAIQPAKLNEATFDLACRLSVLYAQKTRKITLLEDKDSFRFIRKQITSFQDMTIGGKLEEYLKFHEFYQ